MTVIITGATNGIGLAAAKALVAHGIDIAFVGRNMTGPHRVVREEC